jgi:hypothetical protein
MVLRIVVHGTWDVVLGTNEMSLYLLLPTGRIQSSASSSRGTIGLHVLGAELTDCVGG